MLSTRWRYIFTGLVVAVVLMAGLIKMADVPAFERSLHSWSLIPASWRTGLSVFVPCIEVGLSLLWFGGIARVYIARAMLLILCVFTSLYAAHLMVGITPECGCLGALARIEAEKFNAVILLARNALLMCLLAVSLLNKPLTLRFHKSPNTRPGFTLIEVLVVIAILSVLAALTLATLPGVWRSARTARSLANLSSHSKTFASYLSDSREVFPYYTNPDGPATFGTREYTDTYEYFDAYAAWHLALADAYLGGDFLNKSFCDGSEPPNSLTSYWYSSVFLTDPAFWNVATRQGRPQFRPTRLQEVTTPARKALLIATASWRRVRIDGDRASPQIPIPFALVDGHASVTPYASVSKGMNNGAAPFGGLLFDWPGMGTLSGVQGFDIP